MCVCDICRQVLTRLPARRFTHAPAHPFAMPTPTDASRHVVSLLAAPFPLSGPVSLSATFTQRSSVQDTDVFFCFLLFIKKVKDIKKKKVKCLKVLNGIVVHFLGSPKRKLVCPLENPFLLQ